jgi:hypothetical protein
MQNLLSNSILDYLTLEIKMLLRNKKPLNNLFQIVVMYIFSLLVYTYFQLKPSSLNNTFTFYIIVSLLSSSFIVGHGIFMLTWESTYFCFFMTRIISLRSFFQAQYILFLLSAIFLSIINVPVILIIGGDLLMYFSFFVFNIGVLPLIITAVSLFNNERASLNKGVFFNYEGYGLWQYIVFTFELSLPGIIYLSLEKAISNLYISLVLILFGIIGIVLIVNYPTLFFVSRKYKIINGYYKK